MSDFYNTDELCHFGIKGMKWGIRRYQNKDGTLTEAGKKRYDVDLEGAKQRISVAKQNEKNAKKAYNRATLGGIIYDKKAENRLRNAEKKTQWAKEDYASEKVKSKLNSEYKSKSKHRLELEAKYREKGMSAEEAEVAAYKRAKTEKILAVAAGATLAAAAAYVAYKHYDKVVDKIIDSGTTLQNISTDSNKGVKDAFYASMTKMDNTKYRGMYGKALKDRGDAVFETKISVKSGLKLASEKNATKILSEIANDDKSYADTLYKHLQSSIGRYSGKQARVVEKGFESIKKGKIDSKVYNALNLTLADHALPTSDTINNGFYKKLTSKGYDAIMDLNDKKFSGYMSSKPIIVFNGASKTATTKIRQLGESEIKKAYSRGLMDVTLKTLTPQVVGTTSAIVGINKLANTVTSKSESEIVRKYRKEHPNTQLTYKEIVRNYKE